jgi:hypothetical protein
MEHKIEPLVDYIAENATVVDPVYYGWDPISKDRPPLQPIRAFPLQALPEVVRDLVIQLAESFQVAPDFPAMMVMAAIGTAIGGRTRVVVKPGVFARGNIYVLCFMPPAERKSSVMRPITEPYELYRQEGLLEWNRAKLNQEIYEARKADIVKRLSKIGHTPDDERQLTDQLDQLEMEEPVSICPDLLCANATEEALVKRMAETDARILVISGEARDIIQVIEGLYSQNGQNRETVYLQSFDGEAIIVDRVNKKFRIDNPCIGLVLAAQLDVLRRLFANKLLAASGFISRLIMLVPDSLVGRRFYNEKAVRPESQARYNDLVLDLLRQSQRDAEIREVYLTDDGKSLWVEFYNHVEAELVGAYESESVSAVRYPAQALRLALIIAKCEGHEYIEADDVARALDIMDCLMLHAKRAREFVYAHLPIELDYIIRYVVEHDMREFSLAQLRRARHAKQPEAKEWVERLEQLGYVRFKCRPRGANVTDVYEANPYLWDLPHHNSGGAADA